MAISLLYSIPEVKIASVTTVSTSVQQVLCEHAAMDKPIRINRATGSGT